MAYSLPRHAQLNGGGGGGGKGSCRSVPVPGCRETPFNWSVETEASVRSSERNSVYVFLICVSSSNVVMAPRYSSHWFWG